MNTWRKSSKSNPSGNCVEVNYDWRKSTLSANSSDCVEVGMDSIMWNKSTYSVEENCVEVGRSTESVPVLVRDTKDREGPMLSFDTEAWQNFVTWVAQ